MLLAEPLATWMMLEPLINIETIDFIAELRVSFMSLVRFEYHTRGRSPQRCCCNEQPCEGMNKEIGVPIGG